MATLTISPEDEKKVKARGFLSNKGTDNFSGRIITVNGKITAEQQKVIGEAAEKFGNGIVTFTTRLTIEVQGIPYDKIDDFCAYIAKAGLVTGGRCVRWWPVRERPASTAFWIPLGFPRRFIRDFTRDTARCFCPINSKLPWADVPTTV